MVTLGEHEATPVFDPIDTSLDWMDEHEASLVSDTSDGDTSETDSDMTDGLGVAPPPWAVYDASEAQDFFLKGHDWCSDIMTRVEKEKDVDLTACAYYVQQARSLTRDLQLEYAEAERRKRVGNEALTALHGTDPAMRRADELGDAWQGVYQQYLDMRRRTREMSQSQEQLCDDIKARMYAVQQAVGLLSDITQTPACGICMIEPISRVCIPCGHSTCHNCADRVCGNMTCFTCRSPVTKVNKVIF